MAEDSKLKGSRFNGKLEMAKNQIEVDGEITKEFIQKVKNFLLGKYAMSFLTNFSEIYSNIIQHNSQKMI